jgi:hypothetical protein
MSAAGYVLPALLPAAWFAYITWAITSHYYQAHRRRRARKTARHQLYVRRILRTEERRAAEIEAFNEMWALSAYDHITEEDPR